MIQLKVEARHVAHQDAAAAECKMASFFEQKIRAIWSNVRMVVELIDLYYCQSWNVVDYDPFLYTMVQQEKDDSHDNDYPDLQSYEEVATNHSRGAISKGYSGEMENIVTELIQSSGMHWGLSMEKSKGRTRPKLDIVLSDQLANKLDKRSKQNRMVGRGMETAPSRFLEYPRTIAKAYLECVLRVPPFLMSPEGLRLMSNTGLSLNEHPLGRLITLFVHIFRSLFHDAVKHALLVLAETKTENDTISGSVTCGSDDFLLDTANTGCVVRNCSSSLLLLFSGLLMLHSSSNSLGSRAAAPVNLVESVCLPCIKVHTICQGSNVRLLEIFESK